MTFPVNVKRKKQGLEAVTHQIIQRDSESRPVSTNNKECPLDHFPAESKRNCCAPLKHLQNTLLYDTPLQPEHNLKRGSTAGAVQISCQFHFLSSFLKKWTVTLLTTLHLAKSTMHLHNSECHIPYQTQSNVSYVCVWV